MSPLFAGDVLEPLQGAQGVLGPHLRTTDQICSGFPQRTNTNDQTSEKLILWHSIGSWCNFHIASSHQKPTLKLAPSHCQICLGMCQIFLVQVSDHYCSRKCTAGTQMLGSLMVLKLLSLSWKFLLKFTLITFLFFFFFFFMLLMTVLPYFPLAKLPPHPFVSSRCGVQLAMPWSGVYHAVTWWRIQLHPPCTMPPQDVLPAERIIVRVKWPCMFNSPSKLLQIMWMLHILIFIRKHTIGV